MTAQVSDTVDYRGKGYALAGARGQGLFDPAEHHLRPVANCSACWRGYVCHYRVHEDTLLLATLQMSLQGSPDELLGAKRAKGSWLFNVRYDPMAPVCYTGLLLLGKGFIEELYVHMGFHPAWKFKDVQELRFREGNLIEARDCSLDMERFRKELAARPGKPRPTDSRSIRDWIESTFSLDPERQLEGLDMYPGTTEPPPEPDPSPPCPFCGERLATPLARLCIHCGKDWYDLPPGELPAA